MIGVIDNALQAITTMIHPQKSLVLCLGLCCGVVAAPTNASETIAPAIEQTLVVPGDGVQVLRLESGQTIEVSVGIESPSLLPANGRLRVSWKLLEADDPEEIPRAPDEGVELARKIDEFGIYTVPTPDWSKILHAIDPDVYVVYRAPVAGSYELRIATDEGEIDLFSTPRWREPGVAPQASPVPVQVPWPQDAEVDVAVLLRPIDLTAEVDVGLYVESEPNDTPEQAQLIPVRETADDYSLNVMATSDDIEYFDNGRVGSSGDDWYRLEFSGREPRLLTACLSIPDQQVAARIRAYTTDERSVTPGNLIPLTEYEDGKNPNERAHQQEEQHRTAINRTLQPGEVYLLRVEANAPGYDLELRIVRPAPFDDPRQAIRHGLYDHLGQVDAWITNRPRGASVERRIRDSGNLMGTNCMSCHTQSGVWGPAVPFAMGYRPQNAQHWRHLVNTCYQSMRPTNELIDAANNTSLPPLDMGDGPAGTRVAGHAVVTLERFLPPRKLQSMQAIRAANFVLQSGDPDGINAAGPGANVGKGVVYNYAGEILASAWRATGEARYFRALEVKARRMLGTGDDVMKSDAIEYCDDLGHRVEFFARYFPTEYAAVALRVAEQERLDSEARDQVVREARELEQQIRAQLDEDLARLRAVQLEDGGWGFDPGQRDGDSWKVDDTTPDPSPTALALIGFEAAGIGKDDPTVARGIAALLNMQHPTGYWNGKSKTGFVSTSYAMHALARYFPTEPPVYAADQFAPREGESLVETIRRVRDLSLTEDVRFAPQLVAAARHDSPLVRYWAMIGLGMLRSDAAIGPLEVGLGDPTKVVREAAHWGFRQQLIDDRGWDQAIGAATSGTDQQRAAVMRALVMKVDGVLPQASVDHDRLAELFAHALNDDPHPGVRAWSTRAAWQWWIWNPPIRTALNTAWGRLLEREEEELLVENAIRYQTQALFIANGHVANASTKHQYPELEALFAQIHEAFQTAVGTNEQLARRLAARLVAVSATFYQQRGGDGGPGQMGYVTKGSAELFGDAVLSELAHIESLAEGDQRHALTRLALEGAANITQEALQEKLVDYSLNGPEDLRSIAADSISDPRLVRLIAVPEQLEPMYAQLLRGAADPPRRGNLSDPILKMYGGVSWELPQTVEQRTEILQYLVPDLSAWLPEQTVEAITNPAEKDQAARSADSTWYLANGLGTSVENNPDLHFEQLAETFPQEFQNDAEARFWVRSVPWILTFERELPEVTVDPNAPPPIDPFEELRSRALRLFLTQLGESALPDSRRLAVELANLTALRKNPEILTALAAMESFEEDEAVLEDVKKVLSQERGEFTKQLAAAVADESQHGFEADADGVVSIPEDFIQDVTYFRDYVVPEMTKVLRGDERSCMICHGEPGRVPSMELHAPDQVGFLPTDKLLTNYRILQARIQIDDVASSKLLRKPLNVQSGEGDGHQGGRRYQPMDAGYLILTKWAESQVMIQERYGRPLQPEKGTE